MRALIAAGLVGILAQPGYSQDLPRPITRDDFREISAESAALGQLLYYDPILSGNRNISCATCHHPTLGSGDGVSLSIGEGGEGLGPIRAAVAGNEPKGRIPRNAPAVYNRGALEFTNLFHDGRVEVDEDAPHGIRMPAGNELERPLPDALTAQALLPMLSHDEMAGQPGENEIADLVDAGKISGPDGAWAALAARIEAIPEYRARFDWIIGPGEAIHITDIARAIGDFEAFEFRATTSAYDRYVSGDANAMSDAEKRGAKLFFGKAECSTCHAGPFFTDHGFHSIGVPQFGPGKEGVTLKQADLGRGAITGDDEDNYRFRTPSLRNVALTAPYGHTGAYPTLEAMVRHHLDPIRSLVNYDSSQAILHKVDLEESDWIVSGDNAELLRIAQAIEIVPVKLTEDDIGDLVAFLGALTDPGSIHGRMGVPARVPSGLPVDKGETPPS